MRDLVRVVAVEGLVLTTLGVGEDSDGLVESLVAPLLEGGGLILEFGGGLAAELLREGDTSLLAVEQVALDET